MAAKISRRYQWRKPETVLVIIKRGWRGSVVIMAAGGISISSKANNQYQLQRKRRQTGRMTAGEKAGWTGGGIAA